jgi:transposase
MTTRFRKRPWRGDGRPPKLTPDQVRELRAWAAYGTSKAAVARRFNVSTKTVTAYIQRRHVRTFEESAA